MDIILTARHILVGTLSFLYDLTCGRWVNKFEVPETEGTAVITGGGRGIGVEVVKELVNAGMTVIVGVRNLKSTEKLQRELTKYKGKAYFETLDLASLKSVTKFASFVRKNHPKVNLLINNAGVYTLPYSKTEDGYEIRFGTNYIGHFKLTHLLLDCLVKGAVDKNITSRIVTVSSCAHYCATLNWDDLNMEHTTNSTNIYAHSKLAQLLFSFYLDKMLVKENVPVRSLSVHPGVVDTKMTEHYGFLSPILFKSWHEGAIGILFTALSPTLEDKGGLYLSNCENGAVSAYAHDEENQRKLYNWTLKELGIKEFGKLSVLELAA